jgi:hypothetical protein
MKEKEDINEKGRKKKNREEKKTVEDVGKEKTPFFCTRFAIPKTSSNYGFFFL